MGCDVTGTTRNAQKASLLESKGIKPLFLDLLTTKGYDSLDKTEHILLCPAPSQRNAFGYEQIYQTGIYRLLSYLYHHPPQGTLLYTSSIGVYDESNGNWVDETFTKVNDQEQSKSLLSAETTVLKSPFPNLVYRLGGIYGPGRNRLSIPKELKFPQENLKKYLNLIYIEDVVQSLLFLWDKGKRKEIYNGVDNKPVQRQELYKWIATKSGVEFKEPLENKDTNLGKKCSNKKLLDLGFHFQYPTYKEGYECILQQLKT